MSLLALIPLRDWLYATAIATVIAGAGLFIHHERQVGASQIKAAVSEASAKAAAAAQVETARRASEIEGVAHDAQLQVSAARADAARAIRARDGLRVQLDAFVRRNAVPRDPSASDGGEADPIGVLAEVLGRADDFAGRVAAEADANRIAGDACVRSYAALTAK